MTDFKSEQTANPVSAVEAQSDEAAQTTGAPWGNGSAPSLPSVDNEEHVSPTHCLHASTSPAIIVLMDS
jgi:hypothetical protein